MSNIGVKNRTVKKLIAFISIFILSFSLFATVSFSSDVSDDLRARIEKYTREAVGDREELDIVYSDITEVDNTVSLTVSFCDKSVRIETLYENLDKEIDSLFFYEENLFEEGPVLDYIYKDSFSSISLVGARRGQNYRIAGTSGKTEGLLRVENVYDGAVAFRPYYLSSPLPGMRLERINDFSLSLKLFSNLSFTSYGGSLSFDCSSLIYPLIPFARFALVRYSGLNFYYALLGLRAEFNLASVWSDIPVIRNFTFSGEFSLGAEYRYKLSYAAQYGLDCTYMFNRVFSLSVGFVNYGRVNYLSLSFGGKL